MRRKISAAGDHFRDSLPPQFVWACFVTLTYRPGCRWSPRDISGFIRVCRHLLRQKHPRATLRYVWVLELHKSGRPHYHVCFWLPKGFMLPKPDESGAWPCGMSKIEKARRPIGYLLKYASKGTEEDGMPIPKGARLCGAGGLGREGRSIVRWWLLPRYQRERTEQGDHVIRARKGGWVSLTTGEWWPPWRE